MKGPEQQDFLAEIDWQLWVISLTSVCDLHHYTR
jgi:hypothetical protein